MQRLRIHLKTYHPWFVRSFILTALLSWTLTVLPLEVFAKGPAALPENPVTYTLGYAGNNLWNPGVKAGAEFFIFSFPGRSGKSGELLRELYLVSGIGAYLDPGSHAALYNQYGATFRRTGRKGWSHSFELRPLGIYRSFLAETWRVEEGAAPEKVILPGRTYYAPGIGYHLGRNSLKNQDQALFAGCSMTVLVPYNTYVMPIFTIELGWRFSSRKEGK